MAKGYQYNQNWTEVKLKHKPLPELELVAKAQASLDQGLGIPPECKVMESEWGDLVVIKPWEMLNLDGSREEQIAVEALSLQEPEKILPEWVPQIQGTFHRIIQEMMEEITWGAIA